MYSTLSFQSVRVRYTGTRVLEILSVDTAILCDRSVESTGTGTKVRTKLDLSCSVGRAPSQFEMTHAIPYSH